jgi:hypothetical protein
MKKDQTAGSKTGTDRKDGDGHKDGRQAMGTLAEDLVTMQFIIDNRNGTPIGAEEARLIEGVTRAAEKWIGYNRERKVPIPQDIRRNPEE